MGFLAAYLLGGLTFLPLLALAVVSIVYYSAQALERDAIERSVIRPDELAAAKASDTKDAKVALSGWVTVRRTYENIPVVNETYVGMMTAGYRTFMDQRSKDPRRARPKDLFFAILKRSLLFIYEADPALETPQKPVECIAAIQLGQYSVNIFPEGLIDGELFMKKTAVCLKPQTAEAEIQVTSPAEEGVTDNLDAALPAPWFIFFKTNSDKEDWLHALSNASKLSDPTYLAIHARDRSVFDPADMLRIVDSIDRQPDPIPTRWLNAMLGRLFLSVYRTASLENYIVGRIVRKLSRVNKPSFLSEIVVREVHVGSGCPFFSKPMLKELTAEGDASMETQVLYKGAFRITIETVATINLSSRFKPYTVRLILAIILKELEGTVLFRIKKPPSNRLWFGFTAMPRMNLAVEPIVSTRQIRWSMILKPIESRLREIVAESIVLPNMDDISFFDTRKYAQRGGIWGEALRQQTALDPTEQVDDADDEELLDQGSMAELGLRSDPAAETSLRQRLGPRNDSSSASVASAPAAAAGPDDPPSSGASSAFSFSAWTHTDRSPNKRGRWFSGSTKSADASPAPTPSGRRSPTSRRVPQSSNASDAGESDSSDTAASRLRSVLEIDAKGRESKVEPSTEIDSSPRKRTESVSSEHGSADVSPNLAAVDLETQVMATDAEARSRAPSNASQISSRSSVSSKNDAGSDVEPPATNGGVASDAEADKGTAPIALEDSTSTLTPTEKPRLPDRPSGSSSRPIMMPPPKRAEPSPDDRTAASQSASTASIISGWRTKATDKQAIAAGVTQARDTMNRWRASWQTMRKTGLEDETTDHDGQPNGTAHSSRKAPSVESSDGPASPRSRSFSSGRTGSFYPPPSTPTTSLSPDLLATGSSERRLSDGSSPPRTSRTYAAAPTMAIPGIHDPSHRGGMGPDSLPATPASLPQPALPPRAATRSPSPPPSADAENDADALTPPKLPPRRLPDQNEEKT